MTLVGFRTRCHLKIAGVLPTLTFEELLDTPLRISSFGEVYRLVASAGIGFNAGTVIRLRNSGNAGPLHFTVRDCWEVREGRSEVLEQFSTNVWRISSAIPTHLWSYTPES